MTISGRGGEKRRRKTTAESPQVLLDGAGGEVALLGADVVAGVGGLEVDGTEGAVHLEVCRAIDEVVLASELFFDVAETDGYVLKPGGVEGLAAGGLGDLPEDVVAFVFAGADVGA